MALDVAFLKDGKIVLQGPLDDLLEGAHQAQGGVRTDSLSLEQLFLEATQ